MKLREFYNEEKNEYGIVEDMGYRVSEHCTPNIVKRFNRLSKKDWDAVFYMEEIDDKLYISGSEDFCGGYYSDDTPMDEVYMALILLMENEHRKYRNNLAMVK